MSRPQSSATTNFRMRTKQVAGIDLDGGDVRGCSRRSVDRIVGVGRAQLFARGDRQRLHVGIDSLGNLLESHHPVGPEHDSLPFGHLNVVSVCFEQMGSDSLDLSCSSLEACFAAPPPRTPLRLA